MAERKGSAGKGAEGLVGDLARRGELRARDLQKLAKDAVERAERNRGELARLIQKEFSRQVKALELATRGEVDALRERFGKHERRATKPRTRSEPTKR